MLSIIARLLHSSPRRLGRKMRRSDKVSSVYQGPCFADSFKKTDVEDQSPGGARCGLLLRGHADDAGMSTTSDEVKAVDASSPAAGIFRADGSIIHHKVATFGN
jgi:hypothetical protein